MPINSRAKGKRAELQARDAIREAFGCNAQRGQQRSGRECADIVDALPNGHCEVKHRAKMAAMAYLEQAERDAKPGELPYVVMRQNGDTGWVVMFRLADSRSFAEAIQQLQSDDVGVDDHA